MTVFQGATEFMLAMGLEDKMVGTAYIDDSIWPRYAEAPTYYGCSTHTATFAIVRIYYCGCTTGVLLT